MLTRLPFTHRPFGDRPPPSWAQIVFSCLAYTANKGASVISDRVYVSSSVGALVVGICGNVYGRFSRGGSYTSAVPGLMFLVPVRTFLSDPSSSIRTKLGSRISPFYRNRSISDGCILRPLHPPIAFCNSGPGPTTMPPVFRSLRWVSKVGFCHRTLRTRRRNPRISARFRWD